MRKDIVVYVDMDNVLVDFRSGLDATDAETLKAFEGNEDEISGVFGKMKPLPQPGQCDRLFQGSS